MGAESIIGIILHILAGLEVIDKDMAKIILRDISAEFSGMRLDEISLDRVAELAERATKL